jgi:hypothetical protein
MKATDPYQFPYPECQPPLVKDSSDIIQMRSLARAIDSRVTALFTEADDEFITPDAAKVSRGASGALPNGTPIVFTSTNFDNSPGGVIGTANGLVVRQSGFYFVTGWVNYLAPGTAARVQINVDGLGEVINEGLAFSAGGGDQMTASTIIPLLAGQVVRSYVNVFTSTGVLNAASLSFVRITGAS